MITESEIESMRRELADTKQRLADSPYVPGQWECQRCNFLLSKSYLLVPSLSTSANTDPAAEDCPNCNIPLHRVRYDLALQGAIHRFVTLADDMEKLLQESERLKVDGERLRLEVKALKDIIDER